MPHKQLVMGLVLLGLVIAAISYGIEQDDSRESSKQEPANRNARALGEQEDADQEWECEVKWYCMDENGEEIDSDWEPGNGNDTDGTAAIADAVANIGLLDPCSESTRFVCDPGVDPPCLPSDAPDPQPVETVQKKMRYGNSTFSVTEFTTPRYVCRITAIRSDGQPIGAGSRLKSSPQEAREDAWKDFSPRLKQLGPVPGTLKIRTVNAFFYRCYARVQSRHDNTVFDQQVEGRAETAELAMMQALQSAEDLATHLKRSGHRKVRVYPDECSPIKNSLQNVCQETVLCRHQCETMNGWTIVTARRATSRALACNAARAAAKVIADDFGGIKPKSCKDLSAIEASQVAERGGCSGCGNINAANSDAE